MMILIFIFTANVEIFNGDISIGGTSASIIESATGGTYKVGDSCRWENTYKLAQGDSLIVKANVIKGDDISECGISYWKGNPILTYAGRTSVEIRHLCPKLEYLTVWFKNSALLNSKTYHIEIIRVPADDSLINFDAKFETKIVYDTVWREVDIYDTLCDTSVVWIIQEGTQYNLHSKLGQSTGRGTTHGSMTFSIPANSTGEVSYWLGTENKPKSIVDASTGRAVTSIATAVDPVIGLLTGGITSVLSATATTYGIDYKFSYLPDSSVKVHSVGDSLLVDTCSADSSRVLSSDSVRATAADSSRRLSEAIGDRYPERSRGVPDSSLYVLIAEAKNIGGEGRRVEVPKGSSCRIEFKNNSSIRGGPLFVRVATRCFSTKVVKREIQVPEMKERVVPK